MTELEKADRIAFLYEKILDNQDWEISELDELLDLSRKEGAEWQSNQSPWNDTTEKPVQGKLCLVEYKDPDGEIRVRLDKHCGMEWKEMCHYDKISRWAYVEDLLRKGGIE